MDSVEGNDSIYLVHLCIDVAEMDAIEALYGDNRVHFWTQDTTQLT